MKKIVQYGNDIAFHPCVYIERYIKEEDITAYELSEHLETSLWKAEELLEGEVDVDSKIAKSLMEFMGISEGTWLNLQEAYDIKIKTIEKRKKFWNRWFREGMITISVSLIVFMLSAVLATLTSPDVIEKMAYYSGLWLMCSSIVWIVGCLIWERKVGWQDELW